jgi:hypothetical protein
MHRRTKPTAELEMKPFSTAWFILRVWAEKALMYGSACQWYNECAVAHRSQQGALLQLGAWARDKLLTVKNMLQNITQSCHFSMRCCSCPVTGPLKVVMNLWVPYEDGSLTVETYFIPVKEHFITIA